MIWTVFYHDGSTFSDEDGGPEDAPAWGVIAIVQRSRAVQYQVLEGEHYYIWRTGEIYVSSWHPIDGKWYAVTQDAFWKYMGESGYKRVLFGEYISDEQYNDILGSAIECGKSAHHRLERTIDVTT